MQGWAVGRHPPPIPGPAPGILHGEGSMPELESCSGRFFFFSFIGTIIGDVERAEMSR